MYNVFAFECQECWEMQNLLIFFIFQFFLQKELNFCLVLNIAGLTYSLKYLNSCSSPSSPDN